MADLKDFAEKLVNLTVKVSELTTILKDEYGIEPAAAVAVAAGGAAAGGDAGGGEEKLNLMLSKSCWRIKTSSS